MLYSEFVENTGCKETDYNYQIYKRLEILYMNDETITKQEIYEYGKKLVDNSLTEKQKEWNADIDRQIAEQETVIEHYKGEIKYNEEAIKLWTGYDADMVKGYRKSIKWNKQEIAYHRNLIRNLKSCKYVA